MMSEEWRDEDMVRAQASVCRNESLVAESSTGSIDPQRGVESLPKNFSPF